MRGLFIWFVSLILIAISFSIVVLNKYLMTTFSNEYTKTDCGGIEITKAEAYDDFYREVGDSVGLIGCYCFEQFKKVG